MLGLTIIAFATLHVAAPPASSPPTRESWRFYGGDYTTWSALDTLSVRRNGNVSHTRQVVWGQRGPLDAGGRAFDYVIVEVAYDCAAQTSSTVQAHFYARSGILLWSNAVGSQPRSTENSSPFFHFRDYICGERAPMADPGGDPSLATMFERQRSWLVADR